MTEPGRADLSGGRTSRCVGSVRLGTETHAGAQASAVQPVLDWGGEKIFLGDSGWPRSIREPPKCRRTFLLILITYNYTGRPAQEKWALEVAVGATAHPRDA